MLVLRAKWTRVEGDSFYPVTKRYLHRQSHGANMLVIHHEPNNATPQQTSMGKNLVWAQRSIRGMMTVVGIVDCRPEN